MAENCLFATENKQAPRGMFYGKEALEFMQFDNILYQVQDNVLYLTLNRPDVRNALSPEMWRDIQVAVTAAGSDPEIKVVIISGKGGKALAGGAADGWHCHHHAEDAGGPI